MVVAKRKPECSLPFDGWRLPPFSGNLRLGGSSLSTADAFHTPEGPVHVPSAAVTEPGPALQTRFPFLHGVSISVPACRNESEILPLPCLPSLCSSLARSTINTFTAHFIVKIKKCGLGLLPLIIPQDKCSVLENGALDLLCHLW